MSTVNKLYIKDPNGLYGVTTTKGDLLVNNGTSNTRLAIGADGYILTADSAQPTGIKWAANTGSGSVSLVTTQLVLSNLPVTTNMVTPIILHDVTSTPTTGTYLFQYNFSVSTSDYDNYMIFGIYKNGTLISDTEREWAPCPTTVTVIAGQALIFCSGVDIITFRVYMATVNSFGKIHNGNIEYSRVDSVDIDQMASVDRFTTNMTTPVTLFPFEFTPSTSGPKLILVEFSYYITRNYNTLYAGIYKNNVLLSNTERFVISSALERQSATFQYFDSFTNTDVITVKVYVNNSNTDVVIHGRNMCILAL
jgi:hypothetical protein